MAQRGIEPSTLSLGRETEPEKDQDDSTVSTETSRIEQELAELATADGSDGGAKCAD